MINHFDSSLEKFIHEQKAKEFPFLFSASQNSDIKAKWEDMFFYFESTNKKRVSVSIFNRYLYSNETVKTPKQFAQLSTKKDPLLHPYYADACKAITLQIIEQRRIARHQFVPKEHCHYFQKWLGWMQGKDLKFYEYTPSKHRDFMKWLMDGTLKPSSEYIEESKMLGAIKVLQSKGAMDHLVLFKPVASIAKDRITTEVVRRKTKKMPREDDIAVALTIFHDVMPNVYKKIDISENIRLRFVASSYMLCIASTQRFAAENPYLEMYSLSSREASDGQEVFNFTYPGSKGFGVNQKHEHGPLIPFVEQSLNFLIKSGAPAMALARFYENPKLLASDVLFGAEIDDWKGLDKTKPLDLWKLGSLLGLFDDINENISQHLNKLKGFPLNMDPKTPITSINQRFALLGTTTGGYRSSDASLINSTRTVGQLQEFWINHIKKQLPNFPYRKHNNGNKVLLKDALTIFTGRQLNSKGSWTLSTSWFAIDASNYSDAFRGAISQSKTNGAGIFFSANGFSAEEYGLTPHMLRHYSNTIYQESGVSDEHIAIASGRVDIKTNADYDHLTVDQIAFRASRHTNSEKDQTYILNNVITAVKYTELTKRSATDTGVGLCLQDLSQMPCTHLSDFKYHCVDCMKAAFCKGNETAIKAMKDDIAQQKNRLELVLDKKNLHQSELSRLQFIEKVEHLGFYNELLKLMTSPDIEDGSLIRFTGLNKKNVNFQLYDITKRISLGRITTKLPDFKQQLSEEIERLSEMDKKPPSMLTDFLKSKGLSI